MAWERDLRRASFRGLRFFVSTSDADFGLRSIQHEFPGSNIPYEEILGTKQRVFNVEGYVLGFDYNRQRDKLLGACEDPTPGTLVHPYYGEQNVVCRSVRFRETPTRGGIAEFSMVFVEAGELRYPTVARDLSKQTGDAADGLGDFGLFDFLDKFNVAGFTQFVEENAVQRVKDYADFVDRQTRGITNLTDDINDLAFTISDLRDNAIDLVRTPEVLYRRLRNSIELLVSSTESLTDVFKELKKTLRFGNDDLTLTRSMPPTKNRIQERQNAIALNNAIKREGIKETAKLITQLTPVSIDDAIEIRRPILEAMDEQMQLDGIDPLIPGVDESEQVVSDDIYDSLRTLQSRVISAMPPPGQKLPDVVDYPNPITRNSLALSYELYGDVSKEQDIIDRNRVQHPGFIFGGQDLEVLSDVGT